MKRARDETSANIDRTPTARPEVSPDIDPHATKRRGYTSPVAWMTMIAFLFLGLGADLLSKQWAFETVAGDPVVLDRGELLANPDFNPIAFHASKPVLPWGLLNLRLVLNPGAVFGIGANQRWFFIGFTVIALAAGVHIFGRYTFRDSRMAHVAIGMILAGGMGNLFDRIVFGRVRDFLQILPGRRLPFDWTWPGTMNQELFPWVFNVADLLLLAGMIALMTHINRVETQRKQAEELAALAAEASS